jgi:hypothetical protein
MIWQSREREETISHIKESNCGHTKAKEHKYWGQVRRLDRGTSRSGVFQNKEKAERERGSH